MVGPRLEQDVRRGDRRAPVRQRECPPGVKRLARGVEQRAKRPGHDQDVAVDVEVVAKQRRFRDGEDRVLDALEHAVIARHGVVVHRGQLHPHGGGAFAAELVAHRVVEEGVAVLVLCAAEADQSILAPPDAGAVTPRQRDDLKLVDAFLGVVLEQQRRIDDRNLVLDAEAIEVVHRVEAARAGQPLDVVTVPDRAIGKDDLLDPGQAAGEVARDEQCVGQEAALVFQLDQQVVALPHQRQVAQAHAGGQDHAVGARVLALVGTVMACVEAENIAVRPRAARDQVIAAPAVETVVARTAAQRVVPQRPTQRRDAGQHIAIRLARSADPEAEVHRHGGFGAGIVGRVEAAAADQRIGAKPAAQGVVARIPDQHVAEDRALHDLDAGQHVARSIPRPGAAVGHVHGDGRIRQAVVGHVGAFASDQKVGATPAGQRVVARPPDQRVGAAPALQAVGAAVAFQKVGLVRPGQMRDADQHVAGRIAARGRPGDERDQNARRRARIIRRVRARAAIQQVGPRAARQRVVARPAVETVGAGQTRKAIVAVAPPQDVGGAVTIERVVPVRTRQRLDIEILVALRVPALTDAARQAGAHPGVRPREVHDVETCAAFDQVAAVAAEDEVVTGPGADRVGPAKPKDRVRRVGRDQQVELRRAGQGAVIARHDGRPGPPRPRQLTVGHKVIHRHRPHERGGQVQHDEPVLPDLQRSRAVGRNARKGQRRVLDVEVVGHQVRHAQHQRQALQPHEVEVVHDHGFVVHRNDVDVDVAGDRGVDAVGDGVEEPGRCGVVGRRREQQPVGIEPRQGAVRVEPRPEADEADRVEIEIPVVRKQGRDVDDQRHVLDRGQPVGPCDRRAFGDLVEEHRDHGSTDGALRIGDDIGEGLDAPGILVGGKDDGPVARHLERAADGVRCGLERQDRVVHVAVVQHQIGDPDDQRRALDAAQVVAEGHGVAVVARHRLVVDGGDGDGGAGRGAAAAPVGHGIVEAGGAEEIGVRREQDAGVEQCGRAADRGLDRGDRQRVAVRIGVVGQQIAERDEDRLVLDRGEAVGGGLRRTVQRRDGEVDAARGRSALPVGNQIVKADLPPAAQPRGDQNRAVSCQLHIDGGVAEHLRHGQRVAVDIGVVGQQRGQRHLAGRPLEHRRQRVGARHGGIVHRCHGDAHHGLAHAALGRVGDIGELRRAVEIGRWQEGDVAVRCKRHDPADGVAHLPDHHAVAIGIVGQQPLDPDRQDPVLGHAETVVVAHLGHGAHAQIDRRRREPAAPVRHGVGDLRRPREAGMGDKDDAPVAVDLRDPVRAAVHLHQDQRIAVGVEVIAQQQLRRQHQRRGADHGEIAVGDRLGCGVVKPCEHVGRCPDNPVGEGELFHPPPAGGQCIDDGQTVARGQEAEHHRVRPLEQPFDGDFRRHVVGELDPVDIGRGCALHDTVVPFAAADDKGIRSGAAENRVVARPAEEGVGPGKAVDVVGPRRLREGDRLRPHVGARPDRAIGEGYLFDARCGRAQRVLEDQAVALARQAQHEVGALRPHPQRIGHIGRGRARQFQPVDARGAGIDDPRVAIARGIAVGVRTAAAEDHVVAPPARQGVGRIGTEDQVVARACLALRQPGAHVVHRQEGAAVGQKDGLDGRGGAEQPVDDGDLVAALRQPHDQVASGAAAARERDLGLGVALDDQCVDAGRVADRVCPVAAREDVGVVAARAGHEVVAKPAAQRVGVRRAFKPVVSVGRGDVGDARGKARAGPDLARRLEQDRLDPVVAGAQPVGDKDAPAIGQPGGGGCDHHGQVRPQRCAQGDGRRQDAPQHKRIGQGVLGTEPARLHDQVVPVAAVVDVGVGDPAITIDGVVAAARLDRGQIGRARPEPVVAGRLGAGQCRLQKGRAFQHGTALELDPRDRQCPVGRRTGQQDAPAVPRAGGRRCHRHHKTMHRQPEADIAGVHPVEPQRPAGQRRLRARRDLVIAVATGPDEYIRAAAPVDQVVARAAGDGVIARGARNRVRPRQTRRGQKIAQDVGCGDFSAVAKPDHLDQPVGSVRGVEGFGQEGIVEADRAGQDAAVGIGQDRDDQRIPLPRKHEVGQREVRQVEDVAPGRVGQRAVIVEGQAAVGDCQRVGQIDRRMDDTARKQHRRHEKGAVQLEIGIDEGGLALGLDRIDQPQPDTSRALDDHLVEGFDTGRRRRQERQVEHTVLDRGLPCGAVEEGVEIQAAPQRQQVGQRDGIAAGENQRLRQQRRPFDVPEIRHQRNAGRQPVRGHLGRDPQTERAVVIHLDPQRLRQGEGQVDRPVHRGKGAFGPQRPEDAPLREGAGVRPGLDDRVVAVAVAIDVGIVVAGRPDRVVAAAQFADAARQRIDQRVVAGCGHPLPERRQDIGCVPEGAVGKADPVHAGLHPRPVCAVDVVGDGGERTDQANGAVIACTGCGCRDRQQDVVPDPVEPHIGAGDPGQIDPGRRGPGQKDRVAAVAAPVADLARSVVVQQDDVVARAALDAPPVVAEVRVVDDVVARCSDTGAEHLVDRRHGQFGPAIARDAQRVRPDRVEHRDLAAVAGAGQAFGDGDDEVRAAPHQHQFGRVDARQFDQVLGKPPGRGQVVVAAIHAAHEGHRALVAARQRALLSIGQIEQLVEGQSDAVGEGHLRHTAASGGAVDVFTAGVPVVMDAQRGPGDAEGQQQIGVVSVAPELAHLHGVRRDVGDGDGRSLGKPAAGSAQDPVMPARGGLVDIGSARTADHHLVGRRRGQRGRRARRGDHHVVAAGVLRGGTQLRIHDGACPDRLVREGDRGQIQPSVVQEQRLAGGVDAQQDAVLTTLAVVPGIRARNLGQGDVGWQQPAQLDAVGVARPAAPFQPGGVALAEHVVMPVAGTELDRVLAGTRLHQVVAAERRKAVVPAAAGQPVVPGSARRRDRCIAQVQHRIARQRRAAVGEHDAVEPADARPRRQRAQADHVVAADEPQHHPVRVERIGQHDEIIRGIPRQHQRVAAVEAVGKHDDVAPVTTGEQDGVGAEAGQDQVVARTACKRLGVGGSGQRVVTRGRLHGDQVADLRPAQHAVVGDDGGQDEGGRTRLLVAAQRADPVDAVRRSGKAQGDPVLEKAFAPGKARKGDVGQPVSFQPQRVERREILDPVDAVAAAEDVGVASGTAAQDLVAKPPHQRIGREGALDDAVSRRGARFGDQPREIGRPPDRSIVEDDRIKRRDRAQGDLRAVGQVEEHRVGGQAGGQNHFAGCIFPEEQAVAAHRIARRGGPAAVVDDVVAVAARVDVAVVAAAAAQRVVAACPDDRVLSRPAGDQVVSGRALEAGCRQKCRHQKLGAVGKADAVQADETGGRGRAQHDLVRGSGEGQDQFLTRPVDAPRRHVGRRVAADHEHIGGSARVLDHVAAIAAAEDEGVVARGARDLVVAAPGLDRAGRAHLDHVAARGHLPGIGRLQQRRAIPAHPVGELDHREACAPERVGKPQLVAGRGEGQDDVAAAGRARARHHLRRGQPVELDQAARGGRGAHRQDVDAIAFGEPIDR